MAYGPGVLSQLVIMAVEDVDEVNGRDGRGDMLGGRSEMALLLLDGRVEGPGREGEYTGRDGERGKEDEGQLPRVVEGQAKGAQRGHCVGDEEAEQLRGGKLQFSSLSKILSACHSCALHNLELMALTSGSGPADWRCLGPGYQTTPCHSR